jgi:hypothetical protein
LLGIHGVTGARSPGFVPSDETGRITEACLDPTLARLSRMRLSPSQVASAEHGWQLPDQRHFPRPQNGSRLITKIETMAMTAMAFCVR